MRFPNEDAHRQEISDCLAGHLGFAKRLFRYWLEADKNIGLARSDLPPVVVRVLVSMSVKSCRQFRSVIELCERGESADASIVARSMFETSLVVGFVLKPRFTPRKFNRTGKVIGTIKVPGVSLTREFRALLFVTHHVLQPERRAAMHAQRPGMKRYSKRLKAIVTRDNVSQQYTQAIGPEWTKRLMQHPLTYSGLTVGNLARSLGSVFPQWYDQTYGPQSEHVHAADLPHYIQMDEEATTPTWHDSIQNVRGTLLAGIAMFYLTIGYMNEYIDFGVAINSAWHGFHQEYTNRIKAE